MKQIPYLILALLLVSSSVRAAVLPIGWGPSVKTPVSPGPQSLFPELKGMNLEGRKIRLPQDFAGKLNIVVIAFQREQQTEVSNWIEALQGYMQKTPGLELYELPTLENFNILMRLTINNGMRYGIDSKQARQQTVTVYLDKKSFKSRLGIQSEDKICILLVNQKGQILWRETGSVNQKKVSSLVKLISRN